MGLGWGWGLNGCDGVEVGRLIRASLGQPSSVLVQNQALELNMSLGLPQQYRVIIYNPSLAALSISIRESEEECNSSESHISV